MRKLFCCFLLLAISASGVVHAQNLTLSQLIAIHNLVDLPSVETRLEQLGWKFSESFPEESIDQVSWKHQQPRGGKDAVINVFFCNQSTNQFCTRPDVHDGSNSQHAFMILYQPSSSEFQAIKQEAVHNKMELATKVMENGLSYQYIGASYVLRLNTSKYPDGSPRYFVELRLKTSDADVTN